MKKLRICAVTERRSDYSRIKALLQRMMDTPEIELGLIVTGQHLVGALGNTDKDIERDGLPIVARIPVLFEESDTGAAMARRLGHAIVGITETLERIEPDLVFVSFDVGCHLAGAIAGSHMNIPVAHLDGGQVTGSIDDSIRHAITKFAHIHFVCTPLSAQRVIRMGEDPQYIFTVGDPALDIILNSPRIPANELARDLALDLSHPLILVIQHSVTTQSDCSVDQVVCTLEAVRRVGEPALLIYPNIDAGGRRIIKTVECSDIRHILHLPFEQFISLMSVASVMVGNSSAALREAPSFGLPAVNIGIRQQGRERGENVMDADHNVEQIERAIRKAIHDKDFREQVKRSTNPYGDGHAAQRIVDILLQLDLKTSKLVQKRLTY